MSSRTRYKIALLAVLAVLIAAAAASATTTTYWGFNNLTSSNPPSGTCTGNGAGVACAGFNYWDRSQIEIAGGTGAIVSYGFQNCAGCVLLGESGQPLGTYTLIRTTYNSTHGHNPVNAYNRTTCAFGNVYGSASYVQCRDIIF